MIWIVTEEGKEDAYREKQAKDPKKAYSVQMMASGWQSRCRPSGTGRDAVGALWGSASSACSVKKRNQKNKNKKVYKFICSVVWSGLVGAVLAVMCWTQYKQDAMRVRFVRLSMAQLRTMRCESVKALTLSARASASPSSMQDNVQHAR